MHRRLIADADDLGPETIDLFADTRWAADTEDHARRMAYVGERLDRFEEADFAVFERTGPNARPAPTVYFAGMLQYDGDALIPTKYLVEPPTIERTMSEYLCTEGIRSFAVSETGSGSRSSPACSGFSVTATSPVSARRSTR